MGIYIYEMKQKSTLKETKNCNVSTYRLIVLLRSKPISLYMLILSSE